MTQQGDMTSQQPAAGSADLTSPAIASPVSPPGAPNREAASQPGTGEPAAPFWPSPYLAEGQSVPAAYPAPARAGQPRYGEPVSPFLTASPRSGRPGYGQPRRPAAQADGTTTAAMSTAAVPAAAADLPLASAWERLLAMTTDWLLILGASFALLHEQMTELIRRFRSAAVAVQTLGPQATAATNFEKSPATISALVSYFLMAFLMALVYFWALQAIGGATLGKQLLGLRVVRAAGQAPAGLWVSGVRTVLFLIGPAMLAFSASSEFPGANLVSLVGAAIWFADCLILATDARKRSLHDMLAGTIVVRKAPRRGTG